MKVDHGEIECHGLARCHVLRWFQKKALPSVIYAGKLFSLRKKSDRRLGWEKKPHPFFFEEEGSRTSTHAGKQTLIREGKAPRAICTFIIKGTYSSFHTCIDKAAFHRTKPSPAICLNKPSFLVKGLPAGCVRYHIRAALSPSRCKWDVFSFMFVFSFSVLN